MTPPYQVDVFPAWLRNLAHELQRLDHHGRGIDAATYLGVCCFVCPLELEDLPMPSVDVISRRLVRLGWSRAGKVLVVDCHADRFHLCSTSPGKDVSARFGKARAGSLAWVQPARAAFAWLYPVNAGGQPPECLFHDIGLEEST